MGTYAILDVEGVKQFIHGGAGVVIDVLPPEHCEAWRLPGAENACVFEVAFAANMAKLVPDKATPIVLYGAGTHSRDVHEAAIKLERLGYSDIRIFEGGLAAWRAAGLALEGNATASDDPPHPALQVDGVRYGLLPEQCSLRWAGRNDNSMHYGTIKAAGGWLDGVSLTGEVVLDMRSIANEDLVGDPLQPVLVEHLNSDDFFFTTVFPTADVKIISLRPLPDGSPTLPNYGMEAILSLRGVGRTIQAPVHLRNVGPERQELALIGHMNIDRTEWGIIYGSARFFCNLSYHVVYDHVTIDFRMVFGKS